jgi:hypothetical protein
MTEVWPLDAKRRLTAAATDVLRPFRCLLLMPFEKQFDEVASIVHDAIYSLISQFGDALGGLPHIERLDWVTSSGAIQQQIWQKILEADLVFCDITSYNPNVMFEAGVCAAWKDVVRVVFIRDSTSKVDCPFDIKPMRYTEYELTHSGIKTFQQKIMALAKDAMVLALIL